MNFQRLARDLEADEGLCLKPYRDPLGYWTIGIGNRFILGEEVTALTPPLKNEAVARELFYADVYQACIDAQTYYPDLSLLREDRQEVIVQMAFQLGLSSLQQFVGVKAKLKAGDFAGAADNMRNSLWAKQTPKRAERLAKIMESRKSRN